MSLVRTGIFSSYHVSLYFFSLHVRSLKPTHFLQNFFLETDKRRFERILISLTSKLKVFVVILPY